MLRVRPGTAATAACVATMACLAADVMILAGGIRVLVGAPSLIWLAAMASVVRLSAVLVAGERCLRLRAAVN